MQKCSIQVQSFAWIIGKWCAVVRYYIVYNVIIIQQFWFVCVHFGANTPRETSEDKTEHDFVFLQKYSEQIVINRSQYLTL